jgi:hypothetical protein
LCGVATEFGQLFSWSDLIDLMPSTLFSYACLLPVRHLSSRVLPLPMPKKIFKAARNAAAARLAAASNRPPTVDVHSHIYLPRYVELLRKRTQLPRIRAAHDPSESERLIILPSEEEDGKIKRGRPIGPAFYDVHEKLEFMKIHKIDISILRYDSLGTQIDQVSRIRGWISSPQGKKLSV